MVHMIIRKARHRIVTVIVIRLVSHLDALHAALGRGLFEVLGEELALFVEVVAGSLLSLISGLDWGEEGQATYNINQHIQRTRPLLDKFRGVVFPPLGLVVAKVSIKRLLAPWAVTRVRDGGERTNGFVFSGVTEELHLSVSLSLCHGGRGWGQGQGRNTKVKAPCPPIL